MSDAEATWQRAMVVAPSDVKDALLRYECDASPHDGDRQLLAEALIKALAGNPWVKEPPTKPGFYYARNEMGTRIMHLMVIARSSSSMPNTSLPPDEYRWFLLSPAGWDERIDPFLKATGPTEWKEIPAP